MICRALAQASDTETRCSLVRLLPVCADGPALAALKTACSSSEANLKDAAVRTLADWPDAAAWDMLAELYRQSANSAYQALALRALVRLAEDANAHPNSALFDRYRQLFSDARNDDDRKLILGALADAARPEALELVLPLLTNSVVRAEAELAVKRIAESIKTQHPKEAAEALQRLQ